MYIMTVMTATATFYGIEQSTITKDIFVSFTISLFGTLPVFIIKKLFEKSKPKQIVKTKRKQPALYDAMQVELSTIQKNNDDDDEQETVIFNIEEITKTATTMGEVSDAI